MNMSLGLFGDRKFICFGVVPVPAKQIQLFTKKFHPHVLFFCQRLLDKKNKGCGSVTWVISACHLNNCCISGVILLIIAFVAFL